MKAKIKLDTPKVSDDMVLESVSADHLLTDDWHELLLIEDEEVSFTMERVIIERVIFRNVTFSDAMLHGVELSDVRFERCDLSNTNWTKAVLHRVSFMDCRMMGFQLTEATIRHVSIERCMADYMNMRFSDAKQLLIAETALNYADMCYTKLQHTILDQVQLDEAQFSGTPLKGISLKTCSFRGLSIGAEEVRGCLIAREQAYVFAHIFGMKVDE